MPSSMPARNPSAPIQGHADWDQFLHHVKHEITDLADELVLALSSNPSIEIDDDLASLMRSMDELMRLYQARGEQERVEFEQIQEQSAAEEAVHGWVHAQERHLPKSAP